MLRYILVALIAAVIAATPFVAKDYISNQECTNVITDNWTSIETKNCKSGYAIVKYKPSI